jgi:RNA polymerase sigma-70 factor (ECF subfamily)
LPAAGRGAAETPPPGEVWTIVERAQSGDAEAFGELYDRYVEMVFWYVHFRVGSRPQAEDLTSETFFRALRRLDAASWQGRDFGAWLVTIARNLVAEQYKSARFRLEISTADMLSADRAQEEPENDVLDAVSGATLLGAVRKLNPEQQECIVLRFLQGLSVGETAEVMGKNDGAVKALQYRAVRRLGRLLPEGFAR